MRITLELNHRSVGLALAFFVAGTAGYFWGVQSFIPSASSPSLFAYSGPLQLPARSQNFGCTVLGPLPDPECTPGAVFPDVTAQQTCVAG
ncbi:MAG TPA: hypothetical protein VFK07_02040, partial [Candidatus Paceibacterota bacterium]|nr:hypothetical protein [Candidatus Paceibacterota bacterium]